MDDTLTEAQRKVLLADQGKRLDYLLQPLCLWRNRVADFNCRTISPTKRWAGVQVGLSYHSGYATANSGKQAKPASVYYDVDGE